MDFKTIINSIFGFAKIPSGQRYIILSLAVIFYLVYDKHLDSKKCGEDVKYVQEDNRNLRKDNKELQDKCDRYANQTIKVSSEALQIVVKIREDERKKQQP